MSGFWPFPLNIPRRVAIIRSSIPELYPLNTASSSPFPNHKPWPCLQTSMAVPESRPICSLTIFLPHLGHRIRFPRLAVPSTRGKDWNAIPPAKSSSSPESSQAPSHESQKSISICWYSSTNIGLLQDGHFIRGNYRRFRPLLQPKWCLSHDRPSRRGLLSLPYAAQCIIIGQITNIWR